MTAALPRWLVVVRRDKRDLYHKLQASFSGDRHVDVILDRRRAEWARQGVERRERQATSRDRDLWESLGFRLIYRDADVRVYEDCTKPPATVRLE